MAVLDFGSLDHTSEWDDDLIDETAGLQGMEAEAYSEGYSFGWKMAEHGDRNIMEKPVVRLYPSSWSPYFDFIRRGYQDGARAVIGDEATVQDVVLRTNDEKLSKDQVVWWYGYELGCYRPDEALSYTIQQWVQPCWSECLTQVEAGFNAALRDHLGDDADFYPVRIKVCKPRAA